MPKRPFADQDGEVPEILDMSGFRPAREVLPPAFFAGMDDLRAKREALRARALHSLDEDVAAWLADLDAGDAALMAANAALRDVMDATQRNRV
jgi:hypothetical protein